jgi:hypothetical protein
MQQCLLAGLDPLLCCKRAILQAEAVHRDPLLNQ